METLDFYRQPLGLTQPGRLGHLLDDLPTTIPELVVLVQGLTIYDLMAAPFYGVVLSEQRRAEIHLRGVEEQLERLLLLSDTPLSQPRSPEKRLACRCRHITVLLVALLRHQGVPARARCGFASYFLPGHWEDHWVCEYWSPEAQRWIQVDAQLDTVWQERLALDFNPLDLPPGHFLSAGSAWQRCRTESADPATFGISFAGLYGLWFVAGNVVRELAALNKVELLPWDVWGVQPPPQAPLTESQLALLDSVAALTQSPDTHFEALRTLYEEEARLRVPKTVFNALRNQSESWQKLPGD